VPIPEGTRVIFDEHATFVDRELISGGSPWRLLRLVGTSRSIAKRWQFGGVVRAGEERFARTLIRQGLVHPHFERTIDLDEIDIVIPVFNDVTNLSALLDQLTRFHVTVVDDGSRNAGAILQCCVNAGAAYVRLDNNQGPAGARNFGALATKREFLWFVDADVTFDDALEAAQRLQVAFADPLVAANAPRVRGVGGPSIRDQFERNFSPLDMGERSGLVVPGSAIGYVPGACLMVRRHAFAEGFDATFRVGEDVDFIWRLYDRGWLVRYDAKVVVTHHARSTWREWWQQRQRYGASSAALAQRHGERLAPLRSDPWTLVAWTSVIVGQPMLGARIIRAAQRHASEQFFANSDNPDAVASEVVRGNMVRAGGPLARGFVRTFGILLLVAALHPRLRKRALALFAVGTLWRWRHQRPRLSDLPLGIADDLAYGVGVFQGAWRSKSLRSVTPTITRSTMRIRDVLGLASMSRLTARTPPKSF
jgi:mycofactocin system glycosyltransferase